jgi:alcohol dehydrogenase YqhD (iron-dependent ADH family)
MKVKVLAIIGMGAILGLGACKSATNTTTVTNTSTMNTNVTMATPMSTPVVATSDMAAQTAVESALKKAGFNDVMVSATTAEVTLRGSVAKGKLGEAVRIATEAGKKKVNNQLTEK